MPAHPRLRGEHPYGWQEGEPVPGSSPLTRGAHPALAVAASLPGLIPAYAGSTVVKSRAIPLARAHPRLRGEHLVRGIVKIGGMGSSPLTRGAPHRMVTSTWSGGLIPAYAGSTHHGTKAHQTRRAHPRLRGEHTSAFGDYSAEVGSSPLTRGAPTGTKEVFSELGLIPAYAGSTHSRRRFPRRSGAHPRLRGEHVGTPALDGGVYGSSPLTRGALTCFLGCTTDVGLIPAYAGSTCMRSMVSAAARAHPRLRGEHELPRRGLVSLLGSSPLTRGAPA